MRLTDHRWPWIAATFGAFATLAGCKSADRGPTLGDKVQAASFQWQACVDRSFNIQRQQTPDPSQAAEASFAACITEQDAAVALVAQNPAVNIPNAIAAMRARKKAALLGQG